MVENEKWEEMKNLIQIKQVGKNRSEIIGDLLEEYLQGKRKIEGYKQEYKKSTRVNWREKTVELYDKLKGGSKSYVVNGLVRGWIEENK